MLRIIAFTLTLALLVAVAVWFAERPGSVTVNWLGWRIDTTVPILLLALAAAVLVLTALFRAVVGVVRLPRRLAGAREQKRQRKGYLALTDGLAAVAAGDAGKARHLAQRADNLLRDPPLTLLLGAQAAQLSGDADAARRHFSAMLERPETAFLGLRGLLTQALKEGDQQTALDYAGRAHEMNPDAAWLTATLFDLQARTGRWREANATLDRAAKRNVFSQEEIRGKRAVVLHEIAAGLLEEGQRRDAVKVERQAHEIAPTFVPSAVRLSRLLAEDGKEKKAAQAIEESWRTEPHPELFAAYLALWPAADDPLQRVRRAEKLAATNPDHYASHLAVAEAALEARLWGQARSQLLAAAEKRPSTHVYRLLAKVEEAETGDAQAVRGWLDKAAQARPEKVWLCRECGAVAAEWSARCTVCGGFDDIAWSDPLLPTPPPSRLAATP